MTPRLVYNVSGYHRRVERVRQKEDEQRGPQQI